MRHLALIICRVLGSMALLVLTWCAGVLLAIIDLLLGYPSLLNGPLPSVVWSSVAFCIGLVIWNSWIGPPSVRQRNSLVDPDYGLRRMRLYIGAIPAGLLAMVSWVFFVVASDYRQIAGHPARAFHPLVSEASPH